jgi:pimeloyl-ACP methyl ester carboxylesterase
MSPLTMSKTPAVTTPLTTARSLTCQVQVRGTYTPGGAVPIVFLHGTVGLFDNEPLLDALAVDHAVYAPTWPSFGEEEGEEALEDMLDFALHGADVLKCLAAANGWTSAPILIGHDMGAMIAAEMACLAPTSISRLVLLSPYGLWDASNPIPDIFIMLPFEFPERLFADHELGTQLLTSGLDFEDPKAIETFQVRNARRLGMAGKILFPIPNRRLSKRLYRCTTPTLIAWGAEDRLTLAEPYSALWQRSLPGAQTVKIADAGHMVHLEQPQALAKEIVGFLA